MIGDGAPGPPGLITPAPEDPEIDLYKGSFRRFNVLFPLLLILVLSSVPMVESVGYALGLATQPSADVVFFGVVGLVLAGLAISFIRSLRLKLSAERIELFALGYTRSAGWRDVQDIATISRLSPHWSGGFPAAVCVRLRSKEYPINVPDAFDATREQLSAAAVKHWTKS